MTAARYWLLFGTVMGMVAGAAQPPPPPTSTPQLPDAELIEFLGAEDHGDAAWWEMLKQAPAGSQNPAAAPPPPPQTPPPDAEQ